MLRIHFTDDDLGRVRLAAAADPLWEMRLSAICLRTPNRTAPALRRWRAETLRRMPPAALPYLNLTRSHGRGLDFLVPEAGSVDLASGIDAVLGTPGERVAAELARLDVPRPLSGWTRRLAVGSRESRSSLRATLTAYYLHAVAPVWDRVRAAVEADRAVHAHALVTDGARDALAALHPRITWSGRTLCVDDGPWDRSVDLAGRGLRLVPAYFCGDAPVMLESPGPHPTLVLPVQHTPYGTEPAGTGTLSSLLGRTRATALRALATPVTTSALARRTAMSAASASQHAAVLRQAGLVVSRRDGRYVVHALTTLGSRLLAAADHERHTVTGYPMPSSRRHAARFNHSSGPAPHVSARPTSAPGTAESVAVTPAMRSMAPAARQGSPVS